MKIDNVVIGALILMFAAILIGDAILFRMLLTLLRYSGPTHGMGPSLTSRRVQPRPHDLGLQSAEADAVFAVRAEQKGFPMILSRRI
jgi:hypothetical protein